MTAAVQWTVGVTLAAAGWLATRLVARARVGNPVALLFDLAVPAAMFSVLAGATARPIFAGVTVFALIGGLAFADYAKREILREPVLFCDLSELKELFRHPHLYLPYAGPKRILAGFLAAVAAVILLAVLEPPVFRQSMIGGGVVAAFAIAVVMTIAFPLIGSAGRIVSAFRPSGDPAADSARLGLIATLFTYGLIARSERVARRRRLAPVTASATGKATNRPPVVLVQSESFFDVRRLGSTFTDALPVFGQLASSALSGRLAAPAWGANTVRTEFEAITGIGGTELGFDRFNPYHALVRSPIRSLAWDLKRRSYATVCLHPYDRTFYARDKVMASLGFDLFLGQEAFAPATPGAYISDTVLTDEILKRLDAAPQGLFIFAITMENHGPWSGLDGGLARYVEVLDGVDAMAGRLAQALSAKGGVLAIYGDHLPSLPKAFETHGFSDETTDYLVWRPGISPQRRDIAAHELASALLAAIDEAARDLA